MERSLNQDQVERAARMYKTNQDAARALGIAMQSFGRICRKYAIEPLMCGSGDRSGKRERTGIDVGLNFNGLR